MRARPLLSLLLVPAVIGAQSTQRVVSIDSIFRNWTSASPGCAVGVSYRSEAPILRAYGLANLEYRVPLQPESILESGSVAKQFTSAAVALLHLEGKLSLDEDVRKWLPELPAFGGQRITLRHLLTHTSGLRDQWGLLSLMDNPPTTQVHTLPLILHLVSNQRDLNFPVGSEYLYSNTGYALAAIVVQRVSGMSLARFTQERFFGPMGMANTSWRDDFKRIVPGRATAYESRPNGEWGTLMPFTNVYGNGGLLTTVGDMLRWNAALTSGSITGGRALVDVLETRMTLTGGQRIAYALGVSHSNWRGHRQVAHSGSTAGYQTYLTRFPDDSLSIAVFCNADRATPGPDALRIAALYLPDNSPSRPVAATADSITPAKLVGRFRDVVTDDLADVTARGPSLMIRSGSGSGSAALTGLTALLPNGTTVQFDTAGGSVSIAVTDADRVVHRYERLRPPGAVSPAAYVGTYHSAELGIDYEIVATDAGLQVRFPPGADVTLRPLYPDGFDAQGSTVRFVRDGAGRVTHLLIFAGRIRAVRFDRQPRR